MDFQPVKLRYRVHNKVHEHEDDLRETMIDHLDIESIIISRTSREGKQQLQRELEKG